MSKIGYKIHIKRFFRKPIEKTFETKDELVAYLCSFHSAFPIKIKFHRIAVHQVLLLDGLAEYQRPEERKL